MTEQERFYKFLRELTQSVLFGFATGMLIVLVALLILGFTL